MFDESDDFLRSGALQVTPRRRYCDSIEVVQNRFLQKFRIRKPNKKWEPLKDVVARRMRKTTTLAESVSKYHRKLKRLERLADDLLLYADASNGDVSLVAAGDVPIKCHKFILGARTSMLRRNMDVTTVSLRQFSPDIIRCYVRYLYGATVEWTFAETESIRSLAEQYGPIGLSSLLVELETQGRDDGPASEVFKSEGVPIETVSAEEYCTVLEETAPSELFPFVPTTKSYSIDSDTSMNPFREQTISPQNLVETPPSSRRKFARRSIAQSNLIQSGAATVDNDSFFNMDDDLVLFGNSTESLPSTSTIATPLPADLETNPRVRDQIGHHVKILKTKNITPKPDYSVMNDQELKEHLSQFGLRAMGKKKAVATLDKIYEETHPVISMSPVISKPKIPSTSSLATGNKPRYLGTIEEVQVLEDHDILSWSPKSQNLEKSLLFPKTVISKPKIPSTSSLATENKRRHLDTIEEVQILEDHDILNRSRESQNMEESMLLNPEDYGEDLEADQVRSSSNSKKPNKEKLPRDTESLQKLFVAWIRLEENSDLYLKVLNLQPIPIEDISERISVATTIIRRIPKSSLIEVLDRLHVTFILPSDGWKRKHERAANRAAKKKT
ncbi:hypothetical protein QR680_012821 [Steinernema hermaphroditum]|uniref:BTB domain-containing protein n=1 Tax=Steinernema hermaphroditum TaxID=289476 RepID=A0AA39M0H8_9BILA|nr:hypothetical protein QR680_012821 [Steinernema hermaphroditum]